MSSSAVPEQPQPTGEPPVSTDAPKPKAKGSRRQAVVTLAVLVVLVAVVALVSAYFRKTEAVSAKVGDCIQQTDTNSIKIVDCADANATLKVVGRVENKTRIEADINACDAFADADSVYWEGKDGEPGLVLCLAKNT